MTAPKSSSALATSASLLGHDAWAVGNEPVVVIDISGLVNYAKQS